MTKHVNNWTSFLVRQGIGADELTMSAGEHAGNVDATDFTPPPSTDFMVPLTDYGLIAATGEDAANFLHNQLTNDVLHLDDGHARLAGYCTPKGRLLATLMLWKTGDAIMLQVPRQLQPALQKRLAMFIMRAKAKLADGGDALVQIGLTGPAATAVLQKWFPAVPDLPYLKADSDYGTLIRLSDSAYTPVGTPADAATSSTQVAGTLARYVWILSAEAAEKVWPDLCTVLVPAGSNAWRLAEIRAGMPSITMPTQEKFVPQMINFEAVGGVNFQKGCYPGQEIVARSQYLGKLKRRMLPAMVATAEIAAGMEIFSSEDPEQACGMVVSAARVDAANAACLVEIKLALRDTDVHLQAIDGPLLHFQALPYALGDAENPELR